MPRAPATSSCALEPQARPDHHPLQCATQRSPARRAEERARRARRPDELRRRQGPCFALPGPATTDRAHGVVRAIDSLPSIEKPNIAAVEGSEAIVEAFRRLTATTVGALTLELPPSPETLRELQRQAVQQAARPDEAQSLMAQRAGLKSARLHPAVHRHLRRFLPVARLYQPPDQPLPDAGADRARGARRARRRDPRPLPRDPSHGLAPASSRSSSTPCSISSAITMSPCRSMPSAPRRAISPIFLSGSRAKASSTACCCRLPSWCGGSSSCREVRSRRSSAFGFTASAPAPGPSSCSTRFSAPVPASLPRGSKA